MNQQIKVVFCKIPVSVGLFPGIEYALFLIKPQVIAAISPIKNSCCAIV